MDLVKLNDNNTPVTDSKTVAERFGKKHYNVMRDINTILEIEKRRGSGDALNFEAITYIDARNREKPMYEMDEDAFLLLVMGFTGEEAQEIRKDFIKAFRKSEQIRKELEAQKAPNEMSRLEILQMALDSEQKRVELEQKVTEDAPKVEAHDDFMETGEREAMQASLKALGLKPRKTMVEIQKRQGSQALSNFGESSYTDSRNRQSLERQGSEGQLNFQPSTYVNQQNKTQPMYEMTRRDRVLTTGAILRWLITGTKKKNQDS